MRNRRQTGFALAVRTGAFAIVLTAVWTPLNTLLLPEIVKPLAPEALRGSALGAVTLVGLGVATVAQPFFGAWDDAWRSPQRRRLPFIWATFGAAFLLGGVWFAPAFLPLLLCYLLLQCVLNVAQAAFQALIPELVANEQRGLASGAKTGFDVGGNAIGLGVAGGLAMLGAPNGAILATLVAFCFGGALLAWASVPPAPDQADRPRRDLRPHRVLEPLWSGDAAFKTAVLVRFLFFLGLAPVQRFLLFYLEDRFHIDDPLAGASGFILLGVLVAAAGGVIAGLLDRGLPQRPLLLGSILIAAGGLAGMAVSPVVVAAGVAGLVLAFGAGAFMALNWTLLARSMPDEHAARFFGLANVATAGASAIAGMLGPVVDVANRFLPGATYQILFGLCALAVLATLLPLRRLPPEAAAGDPGERQRAEPRPVLAGSAPRRG